MASPQALTTLPSVTLPVTNTGGATFAADYAKLATLSPRELKTFRVVCLMYYLQTVTDYRLIHGRLISDSISFTRGLSNFQIDVGLSVADWAASLAQLLSLLSPAAAASDITGIIALGSDFRTLPEQTLDRMIVFMRAQLGV